MSPGRSDGSLPAGGTGHWHRRPLPHAGLGGCTRRRCPADGQTKPARRSRRRRELVVGPGAAWSRPQRVHDRDASGRTQVDVLPVMTLALAEARDVVGVTPNRREKNTGSGVPTPPPRWTATVHARRRGWPASRPGRPGRTVSEPARPARPRSVLPARWPRAAASAGAVSVGFDVGERHTAGQRAASAAFCACAARHPQRAQIDRQRREGQQPRHRHGDVHQHRAALTPAAGQAAARRTGIALARGVRLTTGLGVMSCVRGLGPALRFR